MALGTCDRSSSRLAAAAQVELADLLRGVLPLLCAQAPLPWGDAGAAAAASSAHHPAAAVGLWIMSLAVDACVEPVVLLPALQVSFAEYPPRAFPSPFSAILTLTLCG
jgi:hypothetical protein